MTTNRRDFLKIAGASALTLIAPSILSPAWAKEKLIIPRRQITYSQTLGNGGGSVKMPRRLRGLHHSLSWVA